MPARPRGDWSTCGPISRPLGVEEPIAGLVGEREVRRPGHREAAPLGAEDHVLEAEAAAVVAPRRWPV